jgi:hypothetical protein
MELDNDLTILNENIVKTMIIIPCEKKNSKKIHCEKEKKMRVETKTWNVNEEELTNQCQLSILQIFNKEDLSLNSIKYDKYMNKIASHIKAKIYGYKQQDQLKKKFDETKFGSYVDVLNLLTDCCLKCHYCSCEIYILYERVREMKQWSLDRINNDIGHNKGNLVVSCLECNLKRRRINKDSFMFTKNMKIIKEDY